MKPQSKKLGWSALTAMVFGFAFSMSAMADNCNGCWLACNARYQACVDLQGNTIGCWQQYTRCGSNCGCPMP